jgi:hypothetical protein
VNHNFERTHVRKTTTEDHRFHEQARSTPLFGLFGCAALAFHVLQVLALLGLPHIYEGSLGDCSARLWLTWMNESGRRVEWPATQVTHAGQHAGAMEEPTEAEGHSLLMDPRERLLD